MTARQTMQPDGGVFATGTNRHTIQKGDQMRLDDLALTVLDLPPGSADRAAFDELDPTNPLAADSHGLVGLVASHPVARLTLGVADALVGAPGRSGWIGPVVARDPAVGATLIRAATAQLSALGVRRVLGPLDGGSTWRRYRLVLPPEPDEVTVRPFLTEPQNPPADIEAFTGAGFVPVARYESRIATDLAAVVADPLASAAAIARQTAAGLTTRAIRPDCFETELRDLHALSLAAFADNFLYTPLGWPEFRAMYTKLEPLMVADLVRLAHDGNGRLVGFCFAFPDPLEPGRIILKTLAVHPTARRFGLGARLTDEIHRIALERGAATVIHALMLQTNASVRLSTRSAAPVCRRYALFGCDL